MTILFGTNDSGVAVDLNTLYFRPHEPASYFELLSYTWGPSHDAVSTQIGDSASCSLQVTRTLAIALSYIRYADRPRIMWIDTLCVKQDDLRGRGQQVKRMADIYSWTKAVTLANNYLKFLNLPISFVIK